MVQGGDDFWEGGSGSGYGGVRNVVIEWLAEYQADTLNKSISYWVKSSSHTHLWRISI